MLEARVEDRVKRNLEQIQKACQRARELVNHILAFSRRSKRETKPVQISTVVKDGLKMLRASIPTFIQIEQQIASEGGLVNADPTQVHQILMNLCINSAHAIGDNGGVIKVVLVEEEISPKAAGRYPGVRPGPFLRLTVSDNGHGVAPELLERIFDPYFTTKEKDGGSGLGLAMVRGIVKRCGGAVAVESEVGQGTSVHVYLPRVNRLLPAIKIPADKSMPMGNERILFVDDDKDIVDVGKQMLESLGYEVTASANGIEALNLFRTRPHRFDLVITDMTMPKITGKKLAQELIKIRSDIPIIICTGLREKITAEDAKKIGIREFAMKPLMMKDLAKTVRKVLAD
jgi:CheY-like chemotaxis protein